MKNSFQKTPLSLPLQEDLRRIQAPCEELWAQGNLDLLERLPMDGLGIVGTRSPRTRSLLLVDQVVRGLKISPKIVISGFARGIDSRAHEAALREDLPTVAILGCGLDRTYPPENEELKRRILKSGGLLLSEFAPGMLPFPSHFLQRNRIIALLSRAVWVVEAPEKSGTLNTAKWARDLGRDLYSVPSFPGDPLTLGNQKLLDDGFATPLWAVHSLGKSWLDFSTQTEKKRARLPPDEEELLATSCAWTAQYGDCEESTLFGIFLDRGWSPERFRSALDGCLQLGALKVSQGNLYI